MGKVWEREAVHLGVRKFSTPTKKAHMGVDCRVDICFFIYSLDYCLKFLFFLHLDFFKGLLSI